MAVRQETERQALDAIRSHAIQHPSAETALRKLEKDGKAINVCLHAPVSLHLLELTHVLQRLHTWFRHQDTLTRAAHTAASAAPPDREQEDAHTAGPRRGKKADKPWTALAVMKHIYKDGVTDAWRELCGGQDQIALYPQAAQQFWDGLSDDDQQGLAETAERWTKDGVPPDIQKRFHNSA